jgi:hypothetical protein
MTDDLPPNPALLPAGLRDLLPPRPGPKRRRSRRSWTSSAPTGTSASTPRCWEFEDGLLAGTDATMVDQTFRLMDPDSHRMMGLRADMTPQAARVATTRLAHWPRPLRVSYAGPSLRAQSAGLAAERQIAQAGIELIGHDSPEADAEATVAAIRSAWARAPGVSAASNRTANPLYMLNAAAMATHFHCSRPQWSPVGRGFYSRNHLSPHSPLGTLKHTWQFAANVDLDQNRGSHLIMYF